MSAFDGSPFVVCRVGKHAWQWTPQEARDFAMLLIRTAGAAEDDSIIVAQLREIALDDDVVGAFLGVTRKRRTERF